MHLFKFLSVLLVVFLGIIACNAQADSIHDSYKFSKENKTPFNPHPMEGDISLPLPCNGGENSQYQLVFRKVYTHSIKDKDITNDLEFNEGTDKDSRALMESKRKCKVRGNFADDKGYFYYLAKYELTTGQYAAIKTGKCKEKISNKDILPAVNISINEARDIASKYSDFLQGLDITPSNGKEKAEVILPFECYWSFAQRGGLAVSPEELEKDLPKLAGNQGIDSYAWGQGASSSNNRLQLIGRKNPNMLGFYDMLGNVNEYMNEPFQATGADGLIGQKGGSLIRGGSFLTPLKDLSSSLRTERQTYVNSKPNRAKDLGVRFMLNVSFINDRNAVNKLNESVLNKKALLEAQISDVTTRIKQQNSPKLKARLQELQDQLDKLQAKSASKDETIIDLKRQSEEYKELAKFNSESPVKVLSISIFIALIVIAVTVILIIYIFFKRKLRQISLKNYQEHIDSNYEKNIEQNKRKHSRFKQGFLKDHK